MRALGREGRGGGSGGDLPDDVSAARVRLLEPLERARDAPLRREERDGSLPAHGLERAQVGAVRLRAVQRRACSLVDGLARGARR